MNPTLLLRADASDTIGSGHILRSLAIAQAWQDAGGEAVFACAQLPLVLEERLRDESCRVVRLNTRIGSADDARETARLAQQVGARWIVADGYRFDFAWQSAIKEAEHSLLVLDDDGHCEAYHAHIVLNPNAGADADFYAGRAPHSQILVGARFALLRREFRVLPSPAKVVAPRVGRVLIAMGGADIGGLVPRALAFLQGQRFAGEVVVLSGTRNFDLPAFAFQLQIVRAARDVPAWMSWCNLALAAAGSTTWELACCGVPAILSVVAPNQSQLASWCDENGVARSIGEADAEWETRLEAAWHEVQPPETRAALSERGREAIDGQGAARVVAVVQESFHESCSSLR